MIYAAEEPVTLAQLAALFGEDALAEQSEAEGARDGAGSEAGGEDGVAEQLSLDESGERAADAPDTSDTPDLPAKEQGEAAAGSVGEAAEAPGESRGESGEAGTQEPGIAAAPGPDAEKRAQRLRERQQREAVRAELSALMAEYDAADRGMEIREIAGGYRVATKPEYHDAVRAFAKSLKPPMKLTLQALETLAVIAYKQPVTAPEVSEIRGVDSGGVMGSLISRKLVTTAGRKQVLGRPILYKTTKEFLLRFGLKDLAELPSMEEFEKMAGELQSLGDEPESTPEQAALPVDGETAHDGEMAESEAGHDEAPATPTEGAGLEVPQEPAQSVIVVEDAGAAEPGMQVAEGGAALPDAAQEPSHEPSQDEQLQETNNESDQEDEAHHG